MPSDIDLGRENYSYVGMLNGHPGVNCLVFQTAGSNATAVNKQINAFLEEARKELPKGVELTQVMSSDDFLYASIHEVVKTLFEAILLVILVVYVFLQDIRSTFIPLVGIIVSLIGTFAFMAVAGFSINLITLFALVLVIGTVVDDAIVVVERYKDSVLFFIKRRWLAWSLLVAGIVLLVALMNTTKTGLVPDEDQGVVLVNVTTPSGYSLSSTNKVMERLNQCLEGIPQLRDISRTAGYGLISGQGSSAGMFILRLKPWEERTKREDQVQAVIRQVYARTAAVKDAQVFAMAPGMIPGYGMGNSLDTHAQDKTGGDLPQFYNYTQHYIGALNQRPEIARAYSSFAINYPQWMVDVDAAKCKRAGITPNAVLAILSGYYGGQYVSDFNRFSKIYKVMLQADPQYRLDEASLDNTFVRLNNGQMAPLSQFVTLTRVYGAETLSRFNMYNSIAVSVAPADGYSTGDAINAVREVASTNLPRGYGYDFGGITREESQQSGTTGIIFGICLLMIYLILSALYESFIIPFAVLLAVPCGLMGSFLFAKVMGLENNIYLQTGLIMLIGLLAKTAILLTEYAAERRKAGMGLIAAAVSASKARLRPILMTALTMIFGLFPLLVANGVGANGNRSLGTGAVGGMFIGTLALLFLVPVLFVAFQWLQERVRPVQAEPTHDWQIAEEEKVSHQEIEAAKKSRK